MTAAGRDLRSMTQPRRGLRRVEAAIYVGISPTKFDEMVKDGRMPRPKRIDGAAVWDQREDWSLYSRLYQPKPRWDYRLTGLLALEIDNAGYLGVRKRWADTAHRKLEALLNDVVVGLAAFATARKLERAEQERRERERRIEQQCEEEARARAALEKARREFLGPRLDAFDEMMRLQRPSSHC